MANNLENKDAYIIVGVDEENDYEIINMEENPNRRNTQNIVDFLREKDFAGDVRPIVHIESIKIYEKTIDIIVIHNSFNTPYYLIKEFQGVHPNNIYTRVLDTNTPKNKTADVKNTEYLWKKRFRLLSMPLDRMRYYLQDINDWEDSPTEGSISKKYYKYAPEFVIEYDDEEGADAYQYYLFNQMDIRPHWYEIRLYYHQTLLSELEGIGLDGGRYFTPVPLADYISFNGYNNIDITLRYFIKDSLIYDIHKFYYKLRVDSHEANFARQKFLDCIIIFDSEKEKEMFKDFIFKHWTLDKDEFSNNIRLPYFRKIEGYNMEEIKQQYLNMQILKRMYEKFKTLNSIY